MQIVDFYPAQGCFHPGETVNLLVEIQSKLVADVELIVTIQHLADTPQTFKVPASLKAKMQTIRIQWDAPARPAGYGATVELRDASNRTLGRAAASFDVLNAWTDFPRYGCLTDFSAQRPDADSTINELVRFHINGLQFYDWQYRHDELLAPTEDYIDPLGRAISLHTVKKLVETARRHGVAAMPYLAVYAASPAFWRAHPESALYDKDGRPIPFGEDFLGLMNPASGSEWKDHLLAECACALENIAFDGLHIDQYGEPKQVWDARGQAVDLPNAFAEFIEAARINHPEKTILFNAVGNWPIEALAASPLDFMYIEIWPPDVRYRDVARVVLDAVSLSRGKPVVIALYLPADRPNNVMLANTVIAACGGTRIELGEQARLLTDPYFPKHQEIPTELKTALRGHYDFLIRYGEWMQSYPLTTEERGAWAIGEFSPGFVQTDSRVWTVARRRGNDLVLNLVNWNGLDADLTWNTPHPAPAPCANLQMSVHLSRKPAKVFYACPEQSEDGPLELDFDFKNGEASFLLPTLYLSGVVFIHE